jgi:serine/threonine protein kinase
MLRTGHNLLFAGKYRLKEHLGTRGLAEVWLANHLEANNTPVVIKIYSLGHKPDGQAKERLEREYEGMQSLHHPHLLKPNHFGFADGHPFLVMPYCQHGNLHQLSRNEDGSLTEREIARLMFQIGGALAYLHERGMAHQDIKPENVLVSAPEKYRLSDFGLNTHLIRKTFSQGEQPFFNVDEENTGEAQQTYIAPHYASPEAFEGRGDTPESDVFSFALMLYELANGSLPFDTPVFTGEAIKAGRDIPELPAQYSTELDAILHACMSLQTKDRLSAAILAHLGSGYLQEGAWAVEIEGEEEENKAPLSPPSRPKPPRPPAQPRQSLPNWLLERWRWPAIILGFMALLLVAGLTIKNLEPLSAETPVCPPPAGMEGYMGELNENCEPIGVVPSASIRYKDEAGQEIALYSGSLRDGKKHGSGSLKILLDPEKKRIEEYYEGSFQNDRMHGTGQYTYTDGSWYIGSFAHGSIDGEGRFFDKKKNITITAHWKEGKMVEKFKVSTGEDLMGYN